MDHTEQNDSPRARREGFSGTVTLIQSREPAYRGLWVKGFEATVNLIKAVIWPSLILYVFLVLHVPIDRILSELPEKLSQAEKISVGSLSVEIQAQAQRTGGMRLAGALRNLSPKSVDLLMNIGHAHWVTYSLEEDVPAVVGPTPDQMSAYSEMLGLKLLACEEDQAVFNKFFSTLPLVKTTLSRDPRPIQNQPVVYKLTKELTDQEKKRLQQQQCYLTELGARAFDSVVAAMVEQLRPNSQRRNTEGN